MSKLTIKQDKFVKAYLLNGGNAAQAAISAGYSENTARSIGQENLTKPDIKKAIEKHQRKSNEDYVWSKADKLKKLEELIKACSRADDEKGALNAQAAISAIKEHNLMQGDNAPTQTENTHKIVKADDDEW
jgi:phage terminase small subunit